MNKVFYLCVDFLEYLAAKLNTTYEAINVWIFCIIGPIVFLGMMFTIIKQYSKLKKLREYL